MPRRIWIPLLRTVLAGLGLCACGAFAGATAQEAAREAAPQIRLTYTRILSSDSLDIGQAALSPDGRWVVFTHYDAGATHLWMVSARGGEAFPITSGPTYDDGPVWFPGSDRIAYRSGDRIVSLAIDPSNGNPLGIPRRVTLEQSVAYLDVSPDGKWIAYTPANERGGRVIRVVPSNGGVARTVVEQETSRPAWAPDGKSLYYAVGRLDSPRETLVRVPLDGGPADTVFTSTGAIHTGASSSTAFLFLQYGNAPVIGPGGVATLDGEVLGLVQLPDGMRPRGFSRDGRAMLATRVESGSPLRVLSLADGVPRTIHASNAAPLSWTPKGDGILFETTLDGERIVARVPVSGGTLTQVRLPERPVGFEITDISRPLPHHPVLSGDGRSLLYAVSGSAPDTTALMVLDLERGDSRMLTARYPTPRSLLGGRVVGPGGSVGRDADEFFYWEKSGGALVLKAGKPTGESRVLRVFEDPGETGTVAVRENRVAYVEQVDQRASILIADGQGEPKRVLTVDGYLDFLVWSPDGRWLVGTHWPANGSAARVMLFRVSPDGTVEGAPRHLGPEHWSWWGHQWLPDSSAFLTAGTQADVWLIPVDPTAEPVSVTEEEEGEIFDFVLSPDGRSLAYAPYTHGESSIWLIDLGDALVGKGSR